MIMGHTGDTHNFGRRVALVNGPSGPVIFKPRTIFWENHFLNSNSKFRKFMKTLPNSHIDEYLGHIDYFMTDLNFDTGHAGIYKYLDKNTRLTPRGLNNLGRTIAFSTIYGISDLHIENLGIEPERVQVLDIECVFSSFESPLDSLLIPSKRFDSTMSIFSRIYSEVNENVVKNIIDGIISEFDFFRIHQSEIRDFHVEMLPEYQASPIRFLIRPSKHYLASQENQRDFHLLNCEIEQIQRGDIPYFFGFIGHKAIYYYKSPEIHQNVFESLPGPIKEKVEKSFRMPDELLTDSRLLRVQKNSIMICLSKILANNTDFELCTDEYKVQKTTELISFHGKNFNLRSPIRPTNPESLI